MATETKERPRLKARYDSELRGQIKETLALGNIMEVPRLEKIVVNMGVGDAVGQPSLLEGAVKDLTTIAGQKVHPIDLEMVPGATFCHPQVASVGMTEAEAKESGRKIKVGKFKLGGVGASAVYDDRDGIVKIVADSEYGEILGAHIVGNRACDMISELVNAMALEGGYQELARIVHPHPTISEAVMEAAHGAHGHTIHI